MSTPPLHSETRAVHSIGDRYIRRYANIHCKKKEFRKGGGGVLVFVPVETKALAVTRSNCCSAGGDDRGGYGGCFFVVFH